MRKNTIRQDDKNHLANFVFHLASIIISAAAIIYLGYHFINSFSTEIETELAVLVTENDTVSLDAYILRNESVIYSSSAVSEDNVGYLFSDGTKVKVGSTVANIYSGSHEGANESIVALDHQIDLLTQSQAGDDVSLSDAAVIDSQIGTDYFTIRQSTEQDSYSNLQNRRDELLTLLNKRKIITGEVTNYDSVIDTLTKERETLAAGYDSITESITTPSTGFFYTEVDGYEQIFTTDKVDDLTFESFDAMVSSSPRSYSDRAIGKVATDFEWYIISEATRESLRYFNEGWNYRVLFPYNNDAEVIMQLDSIIEQTGTDRILLVLRASTIPEDFSFRRMQPVEIIRSSYTGYRVPISAARLVDGVQGVYILVGNIVEFRQIEVLLELDGYYIVAEQDVRDDPDYSKKLGLYDAIITGGKDLYVGKMIN